MCVCVCVCVWGGVCEVYTFNSRLLCLYTNFFIISLLSFIIMLLFIILLFTPGTLVSSTSDNWLVKTIWQKK